MLTLTRCRLSNARLAFLDVTCPCPILLRECGHRVVLTGFHSESESSVDLVGHLLIGGRGFVTGVGLCG